MEQKRRATVFGGNGFIGRHLVARLLESGWKCQVPDRHSPDPRKENLGYVFYCAGLTADYIHRPYDTVEAHVSLLNRILHSCRFESLIYLSSTRLYDSQPQREGIEELPLLLNPAYPRHIYDLSKALGESLCRVAGKGRARVARLSCVYNDHTDEEGFLPELLRKVIEQRSGVLNVDTSPLFVRDYIHLDDVIDALILIATQGTGFIYNVASGENVTNGELFSLIFENSGCRVVPLRNDEAPLPARISIQKMQDEFEWHPVSVLKQFISILKEKSGCCI